MGVPQATRDSKKRPDSNFKSWEPCYFRWKTDLGLSSVGKRSQIPLCTVSDADRYFWCKTCKGLVYILPADLWQDWNFNQEAEIYKGTLDHSAYIYNQFVRREDFRLLGLYRVTEILIWENAVESFSLRNVEEFDVPHLPFNELKGHLRFIFTDVYLGQGCIDQWTWSSWYNGLDVFFFFPFLIYNYSLWGGTVV